jgi:spermidine/putrescine transport system substrate-binding protein
LGGIAAALLLTAVGCGKNPSGPVTLFQWQDYMEPAFLADYVKAYNEKPAITIFADEDEAFSKRRAGFKPDVMGPCYYEFPRWKEAGLLQPIPVSKLKNWNKIAPTLRELPGISAGPGKVVVRAALLGQHLAHHPHRLGAGICQVPELGHPVRPQIQGPGVGAGRRR